MVNKLDDIMRSTYSVCAETFSRMGVEIFLTKQHFHTQVMGIELNIAFDQMLWGINEQNKT